MLKASRIFIFITALLCLTNVNSSAQKRLQDGASLDELRLEVKRLEAINHTPRTLAARGKDPRILLQNRRARLIAAIESQVESLGRYLPLLKSSSGKDDKQAISDRIKELRAEARSLRERSRKDATWWRCRVPRFAPVAARVKRARGQLTVARATRRKNVRRFVKERSSVK